MFVDRRSVEDKLAIIRENASRLKIGDKVSHKNFGEGKITCIDEEKAHVHIAFDKAGAKRLTLLDIFKFVDVIK